MNDLVVSLMKDEKNVSMQLSEKAILGYFSFHHMFLFLTNKYPEIEKRANIIVKN